AEVDVDDLDSLYRCRTLLDAGVPVAFGTDAPFGHADPWRAVAAAVDRALGPAEGVEAATALSRFLSPPLQPGCAPRRVAAGERANPWSPMTRTRRRDRCSRGSTREPCSGSGTPARKAASNCCAPRPARDRWRSARRRCPVRTPSPCRPRTELLLLLQLIP